MLKTLCLILITLVISQTVCAQIETSSVASQFFQEKYERQGTTFVVYLFKSLPHHQDP